MLIEQVAVAGPIETLLNLIWLVLRQVPTVFGMIATAPTFVFQLLALGLVILVTVFLADVIKRLWEKFKKWRDTL